MLRTITTTKGEPLSWWPWRHRVELPDDGLGDGLHPPVGVELCDDVGRWWPVQTVYAGTDAQGLQVFDVVDLPADTVFVTWRVATLPGMTAIRVPAWDVG